MTISKKKNENFSFLSAAKYLVRGFNVDGDFDNVYEQTTKLLEKKDNKAYSCLH